MSKSIHKYTEKEEKLNISTHAFGLACGIISFPEVSIKPHEQSWQVSNALFSNSLFRHLRHVFEMELK